MTTVAAPAGRRAVVLTLAVSEARLQLVAVAYPLTFGSLLMVSPTARPPRHRRVGKCEWTRH